MDMKELFLRLSVALAIGLMIGLERGWQERDDPEGGRTAGFRTHALGALLGGLWAALTLEAGEGGLIALALAFATFSAAFVLFRYRETAHSQTFGATTVVAAMLCFTLGAFAVRGDMVVAAACGVVVMGLLALKPVLHSWLKRLSWIELRSVLVLLTMTLILLPLLPNRTVDPWSALNPFEIWWLTIMIATISFVGYVAIKSFGPQKGILLSAVAGGLTSSTAVTLNLAELARQHPEQSAHLAGGALIAGATMVARVLFVASVVSVDLLARLAAPLGLAGITLALAGLAHLAKPADGGAGDSTLEVSNPFDLATVLKFGALLTAITLLAKLGALYVGNSGAYALALVSGIADVDAITLSMGRLAGNELSRDVAALAIVLAVGANTIAKSAIGWVAGGADIGRRLAQGAILAFAAGGAGEILRAAL